jgi:hypothetical protein
MEAEVPSPFRRDQLSPEMIERYGLGHRSRWPMALGLSLALGLAALLAWGTISLSRSAVAVDLRSWSAASDHVDLTFTVARRTNEPLTCVIRAQDRSRADVGYATLVVRPTGEATTVRYALATIAPAYVVEVLGCSAEGPPRVIEPQFPPRVVPPSQPWTAGPGPTSGAG